MPTPSSGSVAPMYFCKPFRLNGSRTMPSLPPTLTILALAAPPTAIGGPKGLVNTNIGASNMARQYGSRKL